MAPTTTDKPKSVKDVLADVGDDADKAKAALDAENTSDKPRPGLIKKLEKVASPEGDDGELTAVDEDSEIDTLLTAAAERKIDVPDGVDPVVLLGVIRQVDAAAAANPEVDAQPVTEEYVQREAGYISPEYAEALDKGYLGTNPDEVANEAYSADSAAAGVNPPVGPSGGAVVQPGGV